MNEIPSTALYALAAAAGLGWVLVWWIVARPNYRTTLLFVIAATVPLRNMALYQGAGVNVRIGDVIIVVALVLAAMEMIFGTTYSFRSTDFILALFVLWAGLTLAWTLDLPFGVYRWAKFVRNLALYGLIALWARAQPRESIRAITAGVVASFSYILLSIGVGFMQGDVSLSSLRDIQAGTSGELTSLRRVTAGTFTAGTVNALGGWTNVAVFLWLGLGWWNHRAKSRRLLFWLVLAVLAGVQILTFSRSSWVALAGAGVWWLTRVGRRMPRRMMMIVITVAIVGVIGLGAAGFQRSIIARARSVGATKSDASIAIRLELWEHGARTLMERPIGVGLGGTTVTNEPDGLTWFFHNLYLQLLVETGPVGLALFLAAVVSVLGAAFRTMRNPPDWHWRVIAASIAAAVMAYLLSGFFLQDFLELEIWIVFALGTALPVRRAVRVTELQNVPAGAPASVRVL